MKQSLYNVPEGYFEKAETKIVEQAKAIKKKRIALMCIVPVFLAFVCFGLNNPSAVSVQDYSILDNCDIFLEVFEY